MDGSSFDHLSRRLARHGSRRQVLRALAGAFAGAFAGGRAAAAQACTPHYSPCAGDDSCCAGSVCEYGLCMPGCRIDDAFFHAWMSPPENICGQCQPEVSTTSLVPVNDGMSCWSGNPDAGATSCRSGVCTGGGPVNCRPLTACHTAQINPGTGQCEQRFAPAGTACGIPAMCHGDFYQPADQCDGNGFCVGGGSQTRTCAPYLCGHGECGTTCASDADCAAGAHCDAGACYPNADHGQPCDEDSDCGSGICSGGVCCNQRCAGPCETCSAETGGFCSPLVCDDGLSCTSGFCDGATGECRYTINEGTCLIDGVCHASGDYHPETACYRCTPDQRADDWTPVGCVLDLPCVRNACKKDGDCEWVLKPGSCLIDGVCYAAGDPNPNNSCEVCDPGAFWNEWSIGECGHVSFCVNGTCANTIAGEMTADDPQGVCGRPDDHYVLHKVKHPGGGLHLRVQSGDGVAFPEVRLFSTFVPVHPCGNDVSSYVGSCLDGGRTGHDDLAAGVYTVQVSGGASTLGPYTLRIHPDDTC